MESHNFEDVKFVVQACVNSKRNGIPLEKLDAEFAHFYGSSIPYANFGFSNLKSYLYSLPDIYIEGKNVIFCSEKSRHITKLVHSAKYEHSQNKNLFGNSVLSEAEFSKLVRLLGKIIQFNISVTFRNKFYRYSTTIKQWVMISFSTWQPIILDVIYHQMVLQK